MHNLLPNLNYAGKLCQGEKEPLLRKAKTSHSLHLMLTWGANQFNIKQNLAIRNHNARPWGYFAKQNKSGREKANMSFHSYAEYILKITNKQQNKLIEEDNRLVVTGEEGGRGKAKWIKGVNCMAMVGN